MGRVLVFSAQSCREDRRGRCQDPRSQSWTPLLRLVLCRRRLSLLRASRPLHPRAGLRRQIRHPDRGAQSIGGRRSTSYKELSEVERAFANLKDVLDMRPIYHRTDDRVQAHIFVAALAFLLHRAIEKKLKTARLDLSATEALTALKSVRVVDIDLGDGTTKRSVTVALSAPPQCCAPSASPTSIRRSRHNQARPSCSDKPR